MKSKKCIVLFLVLLLLNSCITKFIPETDENETMLVVEGILTDQPGITRVKLSKSLPLSSDYKREILRGCTVTITDDMNRWIELEETEPGTYVPRSRQFSGTVGQKYQLHIKSNNPDLSNNSYESLPMEMIPVPAIDSLFYEKVNISSTENGRISEQACRVYLNAFDPDGLCKYYRYDFSETWMFRLPYDVENQICWISETSNFINIKSTEVLSEDRIDRMPVNYITVQTDRLAERYSMLVNQYSLTEDEFIYWEKLQNITENVGSLYDITPVSISGNIYCVDNPYEQVLGYFSVSAVTSRRIFIDDGFEGLVHLYNQCPSDTIWGDQQIDGLDITCWAIISDIVNMYTVLTTNKGCADCTVRGTNIEPSFWRESIK